jgi:hypothetical protein
MGKQARTREQDRRNSGKKRGYRGAKETGREARKKILVTFAWWRVGPGNYCRVVNPAVG